MTPDMLGGGAPPGGAPGGAPPGGAPPGGMDPAALMLAQLNRKGRKGPKRHKGKKKAKQMSFAQPLEDSGHAIKFKGEGGEDGKPAAMPVPDANTNKHYHGRSGTLKATRPASLGGNGGTFRNQHIRSVQRSRKRK